jgi:hypothetical protein
MPDERQTGVRGEQTRTIAGRTYTTKPLPGRVGLDILARIISYSGQAVVTMFFAAPPEKREQIFANPGIVANILTEFCTNALADRGHAARPTDLIYEIMANTECDKIRLGNTEVPGNVQKHFDQHFAADYRHMIEVFQFVGEANFSNP